MRCAHCPNPATYSSTDYRAAHTADGVEYLPTPVVVCGLHMLDGDRRLSDGKRVLADARRA